jgi:biopolymer transport protein ExbD
MAERSSQAAGRSCQLVRNRKPSADRSLRYGEVRGVLEIIQEAGFRNVGLIAERRSG